MALETFGVLTAQSLLLHLSPDLIYLVSNASLGNNLPARINKEALSNSFAFVIEPFRGLILNYLKYMFGHLSVFKLLRSFIISHRFFFVV